MEVVFFDIGDTLVYDDPSMEDRVWSTLRQCDIACDRSAIVPAIRHVEDYALERYIDGESQDRHDVAFDTTRRLLSKLGIPADNDTVGRVLTYYSQLPFTRVVQPKALELIAILRTCGIKIGVISDWDSQLPNLLSEWGIMPYLDAVAVSDIVGYTKPGAELFQNALDQVQADPSVCLHVGDFYELDVAGARAVGIKPLLFDWRGRVPNPDCDCVRTFDELYNYILAATAQ